MKITILGTEYTVTKKTYDADPDFAKRSINGYCDSSLKQIVICDMKTYPGFDNELKEAIVFIEQETLRHEIVHAFLSESGLADNSLQPDVPWAKNEEMVDWIALNGPKVYKAWTQAGAIPAVL